MSEAMGKADLRYTAPASLRERIDAALPKARPSLRPHLRLCRPT